MSNCQNVQAIKTVSTIGRSWEGRSRIEALAYWRIMAVDWASAWPVSLFMMDKAVVPQASIADRKADEWWDICGISIVQTSGVLPSKIDLGAM